MLAVAIPLAMARRGRTEQLWDSMAYAARYGHQPLSEMMDLTMAEVVVFVEAVSRIIVEERGPR